MLIHIRKKAVDLTIEKVLSIICFFAGIAFLIAALFGIWRYFVTMTLCFAICVMISDDKSDKKEERH